MSNDTTGEAVVDLMSKKIAPVEMEKMLKESNSENLAHHLQTELSVYQVVTASVAAGAQTVPTYFGYPYVDFTDRRCLPL